jgi:hypothetical protein
VVALLRLQYRVANPQSQRKNTILQTRTAKNGYAIFGFGLTHALAGLLGLDRRNIIVGKCSWKAGTANNKHIGKMAALPPLENMCEIESSLPAGKCSVAATSPICWTLVAMAEQRFVKQTITPEKTIFNKTPSGKLQRIFINICEFEKY